MSHARAAGLWYPRGARRGALALAPLGALAAIVATALVTHEVRTSLLAYAVGATVAAVAGALLGGLGGAVRLRLVRRRRRRHLRDHPRAVAPAWVLHRTSASLPMARR